MITYKLVGSTSRLQASLRSVSIKLVDTPKIGDLICWNDSKHSTLIEVLSISPVTASSIQLTVGEVDRQKLNLKSKEIIDQGPKIPERNTFPGALLVNIIQDSRLISEEYLSPTNIGSVASGNIINRSMQSFKVMRTIWIIETRVAHTYLLTLVLEVSLAYPDLSQYQAMLIPQTTAMKESLFSSAIRIPTATASYLTVLASTTYAPNPYDLARRLSPDDDYHTARPRDPRLGASNPLYGTHDPRASYYHTARPAPTSAGIHNPIYGKDISWSLDTYDIYASASSSSGISSDSPSSGEYEYIGDVSEPVGMRHIPLSAVSSSVLHAPTVYFRPLVREVIPGTINPTYGQSGIPL